MKKHLLAVVILTAACGINSGFAQQDAHFTQYMFNQLYFNPGAAGVEQGFRGGLLYRNQWTGYKGLNGGGNPQNVLFTGSAPILSANMGVGLVINSDQIGPLTDLQASLNGAYHFKVGAGKLSAGIRLGMHSRSISSGDLKVNDQTDPQYQALLGSNGQSVADFGFGLFYASDKVFVGASSSHLSEPKFDFGAKSTLNRHYYLTGGYNFDLSPSIVLTPSVNIKYDSKVYQYELSAVAKINNQFFVGLAYREQDAVSGILGVAFLKDNRLRLTYSIDYTVPSTEAKKATSHEIMASYFLPMTLRGPKPIIRTPRYRK